MTPAPYYADEHVQLYHGDFRDILPQLELVPDLVVADPPYGETSLDWDRWPDGWPDLIPGRSMWCFGSMRMFLERRDEFTGWKLSQDVVWEKHNGSGFATDRFRRVHEHALHFYKGDWSMIRHETPVTHNAVKRRSGRKAQPAHTGSIGINVYETEDGGPLLCRSVLYAPAVRFQGVNETEKPRGILEPLIEYGCPPGGLVLDVFAGSCSTLVAARALGRRAIGIEKRESQCEIAVSHRLSQSTLLFEGAS